jgi:hypothetical protein
MPGSALIRVSANWQTSVRTIGAEWAGSRAVSPTEVT